MTNIRPAFITSWDGHGWENLRYVEIDPYVSKRSTRVDHHIRRFNLEQFCPLVDKWHRMLVPGQWGLNFESENETPVPNDKCTLSQRRYTALAENVAGTYKYIIIATEKHGTQHFDASSTEAIGRAAIYLLKQRAENGFYYELELDQQSIDKAEPKEPTQKPEDYPLDGEFAKLAQTQWDTYNRKKREANEATDFRTFYNEAINDTNYLTAARLLQGRNDFQYEGFEIEQLLRVES